MRTVAVKIGTTQWRSGDPAEGEVAYTGPLLPDIDGVPRMVWDDSIGNIRPMDADETAANARSALIAAIKLEARRRITTRYPEWKQSNMTARVVELVGAGQASGVEWDALQAAWGWVKAVRAHSDALEASVLAGAVVDIYAGWPA